jgi:hypothetical protein
LLVLIILYQECIFVKPLSSRSFSLNGFEKFYSLFKKKVLYWHFQVINAKKIILKKIVWFSLKILFSFLIQVTQYKTFVISFVFSNTELLKILSSRESWTAFFVISVLHSYNVGRVTTGRKQKFKPIRTSNQKKIK